VPALTVRLAAAYEEPRLLKFHLDDVGSAAGRAAELADPRLRVGTRGEVLTAGDLADRLAERDLRRGELVTEPPGGANGAWLSAARR